MKNSINFNKFDVLNVFFTKVSNTKFFKSSLILRNFDLCKNFKWSTWIYSRKMWNQFLKVSQKEYKNFFHLEKSFTFTFTKYIWASFTNQTIQKMLQMSVILYIFQLKAFKKALFQNQNKKNNRLFMKIKYSIHCSFRTSSEKLSIKMPLISQNF